jgi:hypothetical protein
MQNMARALDAHSLERVRSVLLKDGGIAAMVPSKDMRGELPLCFAIKKKCFNVDIIALLLDHGADADAADFHGQTPLSLLSAAYPDNKDECNTDDDPFALPTWSRWNRPQSPSVWLDISAASGVALEDRENKMSQERENNQIRIASLLIACGADPQRPDELGDIPGAVASKASKRRLACLLSNHGGVQASIAFSRTRSLVQPMVPRICSFIIPEPVLWRASQLLDFIGPLVLRCPMKGEHPDYIRAG